PLPEPAVLRNPFLVSQPRRATSWRPPPPLQTSSARTAAQHVVAAAAEEPIVAAEADDDVGAARPGGCRRHLASHIGSACRSPPRRRARRSPRARGIACRRARRAQPR